MSDSTDIVELERRIIAALGRIRDRLDQGPAMPEGDAVALQAQLATEKAHNAQLEDRVQSLKDRQDKQVADLTAQVEKARAQAQTFERDLDHLRQANAELRAEIGDLRSALAASLPDAQLVNRAMQAELDALRALQAAEATEVSAVLAALKPLLEEAR